MQQGARARRDECIVPRRVTARLRRAVRNEMDKEKLAVYTI